MLSKQKNVADELSSTLSLIEEQHIPFGNSGFGCCDRTACFHEFVARRSLITSDQVARTMSCYVANGHSQYLRRIASTVRIETR